MPVARPLLDVQGLAKAAGMEKILASALSSILSRSFEILSVDVFDTLLLRCHRSDERRSLALAEDQAARLRAAGFSHSAKRLHRSRREVQSLVYRGLEMYRPSGDVTYDQLTGLQGRLLNLTGQELSLLREAEIAFEIRNLRPNRPLFSLLDELRGRGKRLIAVSDTPLTEATLRRIVEAVGGRVPVDWIYTSADERATKHSGSLFDAVARSEAVEPARILHVGDNRWSDVTMPRRHGLQAEHLRRPRLLAAWRRAQDIPLRLQHAPLR